MLTGPFLFFFVALFTLCGLSVRLRLRSMDSGPGGLGGEDCCGREREACDVMASDLNGSMELDGGSVGGGETLAMMRGASAQMVLVNGQQSDLGLPLRGGADIGGAAADRTGGAGAEPNVATAGSTERQGIAALEASLAEMLRRISGEVATVNSAEAAMEDMSVRSSRFVRRVRQLCKERPEEIPEAWRATLALFKTTFKPAGQQAGRSERRGRHESRSGLCATRGRG